MSPAVWPAEKARKHILIAAYATIISGIFSLLLGIDDVLQLGRGTSAFLFPYLFNFLSFVIAGVQIYVGTALKACKPWAKAAVVSLLFARLFLSYYDYLECGVTLILMGYLFYVLRTKKAGWLFKT